MQQRSTEIARRLSTGIDGLDALLGGGLLRGRLTVVVGATGIGKTQFGLHFAEAGQCDEGRRGVVFDMTCRGDSQAHHEYARRMFGWELRRAEPKELSGLDDFFSPQRNDGDYLHVFDYRGPRPRRAEADFDAWKAWQAELTAKLNATIAFFYGNFIRGARRAVVDGIDPTDDQAESVQFDLFEYVYQQIFRKEADWVARDLFRQAFRQNAEKIAQSSYQPSQIGCLLLCTSRETMLDDLIERPIEHNDWLANASTVIYLGNVRYGNKRSRALYVSKHRGSACSERIVPFDIDAMGIRLR